MEMYSMVIWNKKMRAEHDYFGTAQCPLHGEYDIYCLPPTPLYGVLPPPNHPISLKEGEGEEEEEGACTTLMGKRKHNVKCQ